MNVTVITLIFAIVGLFTLLIKWCIDPKRNIEAKISECEANLKAWREEVDNAMTAGDDDDLTEATQKVKELELQLAVLKAKQGSMNNIVKVITLFLILGACGCVRHVYYNNDDRVYAAKAKQGVCSNVGYDCVVMAQGNFRDLLKANPTVKVLKVQGDIELPQESVVSK